MIDVEFKKKTPLHIVHGFNDPIYPWDQSKQFYERLTANGLDHFTQDVRGRYMHAQIHALQPLEEFCCGKMNEVSKEEVTQLYGA